MWYEKLLQKGWIPEFLLRYGVRRKISGRIDTDPRGTALAKYQNTLYNQLNQSPIAIHTEMVNEQHYELPAEFFEIILGPRMKYSSCLFDALNEPLEYSLDVDTTNSDLLATAEERMLERTVQRAKINPGDTILDLGCGWGSLTLFLADRFDDLSITSISNSQQQRQYIEKQVDNRGLDNVEVLTADISEFDFADGREFDVILSVEMFEHMRNYSDLLKKIRSWLKPGGTLFVHMFARYGPPYLFEASDEDNFMVRYFFTGGTMLNITDLPIFSPDDLDLQESWEIDGRHYERTLEIWLARMKENKEKLLPILKKTYGDDFEQWWEYWKIFFIVCAELFGFNNGKEWVVMHYLFSKT